VCQCVRAHRGRGLGLNWGYTSEAERGQYHTMLQEQRRGARHDAATGGHAHHGDVGANVGGLGGTGFGAGAAACGRSSAGHSCVERAATP